MASPPTGGAAQPPSPGQLEGAVAPAGDRLALDRGPRGDPPEAAAPPPPPVEPRITGMEWVLPDASARQALLELTDDDGCATAPPDTSAFRRPSARDPDLDRAILPPRAEDRSSSNLEPLLIVPVQELSAQMRAAWRAAEAPAPPPARAPVELARITLTSFAAPGQACPACGGPLRIVRSAREERMDATWFRFEWLLVERSFGDCPDHARVETVPLALPAFLAPDRVGNGLLAWLGTWRWRDHMPGHEIARLLRRAGLACTDTHVARWLAMAQVPLAGVAALVRAAVLAEGSGTVSDERGLDLVDGGVHGRLRATVGRAGVAFRWSAESGAAAPADPKERARRVLLDLRGWSRAGRQASLRRKAAFAVAVDPSIGGRLAWRLEELHRAVDRAEEAQAFDALSRILGGAHPGGLDPSIRALGRELGQDTESLHRLGPRGPLDPLPLPEHVRHALPAWVASQGDGGASGIADWLTIVESCEAAGLQLWPYLRDLLTAAAEQGPAFDPGPWVPATRGARR